MSLGLDSINIHIIIVILTSAIHMSALMDGITPVMESDSLQIIPAPWDTTPNQFHLLPFLHFLCSLFSHHMHQFTCMSAHLHT